MNTKLEVSRSKVFPSNAEFLPVLTSMLTLGMSKGDDEGSISLQLVDSVGDPLFTLTLYVSGTSLWYFSLCIVIKYQNTMVTCGPLSSRHD